MKKIKNLKYYIFYFQCLMQLNKIKRLQKRLSKLIIKLEKVKERDESLKAVVQSSLKVYESNQQVTVNLQMSINHLKEVLF